MQPIDDLVSQLVSWLIGTPRLVAGFFGGLVAMLLLKDTWPRRLSLVAGALPASYYGGEALVSMFGGNEGLYGFLCGIFALALAKRLFAAVEGFDAAGLLQRIVDKMLGGK